jgi:hypothetical protein
MAEPFWSQTDAVGDEVSTQEERPVPVEPQASGRADEQVIEGPVWMLALGLVCFVIVIVTVIIDLASGGSEPDEYGQFGFVFFILGIVLPIKGYLQYNKSMVISWDSVSHHLDVAFASRKLEGRKTFFSYDMQPGDDIRFESHTDHGVGEDSSSTTTYWVEVHRRDGTVAIDTPTFSEHYWSELPPILLAYQGKVNAAGSSKSE